MDNTNFATGQVVTGFSFPVVALYSSNNGAPTYSNGMDLARGVEFSPEIETSGDDNDFYANNRASEGAQRRFRSGTLGLTDDGVLRAAETTIRTSLIAASERSCEASPTALRYSAPGFIRKCGSHSSACRLPHRVRILIGRRRIFRLRSTGTIQPNTDGSA